MAAPTNTANVKKALANSEPSTHGTGRLCRNVGDTEKSWRESGRNYPLAWDPTVYWCDGLQAAVTFSAGVPLREFAEHSF